jgi:hypothetical protein
MSLAQCHLRACTQTLACGRHIMIHMHSPGHVYLEVEV